MIITKAVLTRIERVIGHGCTVELMIPGLDARGVRIIASADLSNRRTVVYQEEFKLTDFNSPNTRRWNDFKHHAKLLFDETSKRQ